MFGYGLWWGHWELSGEHLAANRLEQEGGGGTGADL